MLFTLRLTKVLLLLVLIFNISCAKDNDLLQDYITGTSLNPEQSYSSNTEEGADNLVSRTVTFYTVEDAYIQGDATSGKSAYDQDLIRLQEDWRTSYLMFDLSGIDGPIESASLEITITGDQGDGTIQIYSADSDSWTEDDLSDISAPKAVSLLAEDTQEYLHDETVLFELDASEIVADKNTLILTHSAGNDLAFASKEHTSKRGPKLKVNYRTSPESPDPETGEAEATTESGATTESTTTDESADSGTSSTSTSSYPPADYYVTVNGSAFNDGKTEATAWSITHAFQSAQAGDVVYIKAGDYGNVELIADNSGTSEASIQFIGYFNTPGDIQSSNTSTFQYGDPINSNSMPLLKGISDNDGLGLNIQENHVEVHNMHIDNYKIGLVSTGDNVIIKNVITSNNGLQANNSIQGGRGFQIYGDQTLLENCVNINSNGEGINLKGSNNSIVRSCEVYSDNLINMGGYYIAITFGGTNNIIENCTIYRDPSGDNQNNPHQGHGYILKDQATNNIIRNSVAYNTGIEVNFSGVHNNIFENVEIFGNYSTYSSQFSSCIAVKNGAHHNEFNNIIIKDSRYPISFWDFNDGYVGPGGDRDETQGGNFNIFRNIQVDGANNVLYFASEEVGWAATSQGNEFYDCIFQNIRSVPFSTYQTTSGTRFVNSSFINLESNEFINLHGSTNTLPISFENCTWSNVNFTPPN